MTKFNMMYVFIERGNDIRYRMRVDESCNSLQLFELVQILMRGDESFARLTSHEN